MRNIICLLVVLNFFQLGFTQEINKKVTDKNGREKLLGLVTKEAFEQMPFNIWFSKQYEIYNVRGEVLKPYIDEIKSHQITIFMGTWCGDSRREVPRFYRLLASIDYPMEKLKVVCVDYLPESYKKSPGGEEKGLNIVKVPTFIFHKNSNESGRIIERPILSLESDIVDILRD